MTLEEFDQLFDKFEVSAFHLETNQTYAMPDEDERIRAWREGRPRPERSVRTSPWLRRIALTTVAGKHWRRVHIIEHPLSEYLRYELVGYIESQAAGDVIGLADRGTHPELAELGPDFWLFDGITENPFGALLHFDDAGNLLSIDHITDTSGVSELKRQAEIASKYSTPLADYLVSHGRHR